MVLTTWLIPDCCKQLRLVTLKRSLSFLYRVDENVEACVLDPPHVIYSFLGSR